ncbi:MAG: hypothetical protein [Arizlama microvirus]|nr:MAG: hypothetical protein [Arizlama microvirus]
MSRSQRTRTTSKSGGSGKSPKTDTSSRKGNISAPPPASFAEVFGKVVQEHPEVARATKLLEAARARLESLEKNPPVGGLRFLETRHKQRVAREKAHIIDLVGYMEALKGGIVNDA